MSFVSYAQNCEDVLLHRVFGGQETGFYVDVGAYHPVTGSTTKAFYDQGWSGINIEPGSVFAELAAARPRDVNLQMAVLDRAGEAAFVENAADRGASCVALEANGCGAGRMVPCDTLEAIVRDHSGGRPVDFVKLDAEGSEAAIVRSTDWRRLRPRVLLVEATLPWSSMLVNQEWEPELLGQGYVRAYFDGINCFYVPEEEVPALLRHFQVPVNVLDRVEHHDTIMLRSAAADHRQEAVRVAAERDATGVALDALRAEHDSIQAVLDDRQKEAARLAADRDVLRTAAAAQKAELGALVAARDALHAATDAQQRETALIAAERDHWRAEASQLAVAISNLETRPPPPLPEPEPQPAPPPPLVRTPPPGARTAARRMALAAYKLVRPAIRPLVWRLRGFMIGGLTEQLRQLSAQVAAQPVPQPPIPRPLPPPVQIVQDDTAASEMRRLAAEMERTLLTLAMERAPDPWAAASLVVPEPNPATQLVNLRLPRGRATAVECTLGDLSVSASLAASGGDWEPHIRRYLEAVVRPDWVCLDIGANIGAHTLSLAVLANQGRVVAFEADAANFDLLSRNAGALEPEHGGIEAVHLALWDRHGTLVCGGADELAGCSFIAEDGADRASIEQRLRTVVSADAIGGTALTVRSGTVSAQPLDAWADENPLPRLDLIKLDVEGAEVRVIRGADSTLRSHQPILAVEYNPACAAAYFGQAPDALFRELEPRFASINALETDGTLTPLADWAALRARLAAGKGWEDLVCLPAPLAPS